MAIAPTAGATASGGSQVASSTITVPAGILGGDVVYVWAIVVPISASVAAITASSTGTTPVAVPSGSISGSEPLPATVTGQLFTFIAAGTTGSASSDVGKVITLNYSASGFPATALQGYSGANTATPVDVIQGAFGGAGAASVTCPTLSTGAAGDWAVFFGGGAAEGNNLTIPAGSTSRQSVISGNAVAAVIADSGAAVGGAGTAVGGGTFTTATATNSILVALTTGLEAPGGGGAAGGKAPASPLMPPGLSSPAAWQFPPYPRLGQVTTIAGSGGVVLPKPSPAGAGVLTVATARPPLMPPGLSSPAAWQFPYRRAGQVMTIAGSGGVILPKPSLSGAGAAFTVIPRPPLMPPGLSSPAAWQFPYRRAGQVTTIAGSGGVVLPKPSPAGAGTEGTVTFAQRPLMPPGLASPAAWQRPAYRRLGQTVTAAGSGGVVLPKAALSGSGLLTVTGSGGVTLPKPSLSGSGAVAAPSGIARPPLMPPGLRSPAAWQHPRYARLPLAVTTAGITGSGGVVLPKPSLAAASPVPVTAAPPQGGWWQLHSIYEYARQEREFWDSQPPMACPRCGEPMRPAPSSDSGSAVESYCQFDGFRYPEDWDASTMRGM